MYRENVEKTTQCLTSRSSDDAFALCLLTSELANATNSLSLLTSTLLRRLFVIVAHFHFAEDAFALHLLLESAEGLIDIVIADKYLHENHVPLVLC